MTLQETALGPEPGAPKNNEQQANNQANADRKQNGRESGSQLTSFDVDEVGKQASPEEIIALS